MSIYSLSSAAFNPTFYDTNSLKDLIEKKASLSMITAFLSKNTTAIEVENIDLLNLIENPENMELLKVLINFIDPSKTYGEKSWTLLHHAVALGSKELVQALIEKKADVQQIASTGETPLYIAIKNGNVDILEELLNPMEEFKHLDLMHTAATHNQPHVIRWLVLQGFDINARDSKDKTPLYYAIIGKHEENVEEILVQKGDKCLEGDSAYLIPAIQKNCPKKIIELLIRYGSDIRLEYMFETNSLGLAAKFGNLDAFQVILEIDEGLICPIDFLLCHILSKNPISSEPDFSSRLEAKKQIFQILLQKNRSFVKECYDLNVTQGAIDLE